MSLVRILCVDDASYWRKFVSFMLRPETAFKVVSEASDGCAAVDMATRLHPTIVLLDLHLPKLSGIEVAKQIRVLAPESKILFVSEEEDLAVVADALQMGASGYILKHSAGQELAPAIYAAVRGETFVSRGLLPATR